MTFDQVLIEGLVVPVGGGGGRLSLFLFPIRKLFVGSPLKGGVLEITRADKRIAFFMTLADYFPLQPIL